MLLYNNQKEFIGIDQTDLNILGFKTLAELQSEVSDFADSFVKKPGYVHNFKHVNWIDFVTCADSSESTKVLMHLGGKYFRATLDIKVLFLSDAPSSHSFLVYLSNIKELQTDANGNITDTFVERPKVITPQVFETPVIESSKFELPKEEIKPRFEERVYDNSAIDLEFDTVDEILPKEEYKIQIEEQKPIVETFKAKTPEPRPAPTPPKQKKEPEIQTSMEVFDNGYVYDPNVASSELGLPVDLIEEFIEDFIAQAKEFKENLYAALADGDKDQVKILSHKLKGVAANLRIEDALESLIIVNTSSNDTEIKEQLDLFYKIISKLSGEKISVTKTTQIQEQQEIVEEIIEEDFTEDSLLEAEIKNDILDDDIFSLPIKQEEEKLYVPQQEEELDYRIEIPELADDEYFHHANHEETENFLSNDYEEIEIEPELSIEEPLEMEDIFSQEKEQIVTPPKSIEINYDTRKAAAEIGLSQEHFEELLEDYIQESKSLSEAIGHAIESDIATLWRAKAMQLKGMSDNMRINNFMKELETLISTTDMNVARDSHEIISQYLNAISNIKG